MEQSGFAFAMLDPNGSFTQYGFTKREIIAAMAMQGLLASWGEHDVTDFWDIASDSVKAADALLSALSTSSNQVNSKSE